MNGTTVQNRRGRWTTESSAAFVRLPSTLRFDATSRRAMVVSCPLSAAGAWRHRAKATVLMGAGCGGPVPGEGTEAAGLSTHEKSHSFWHKNQGNHGNHKICSKSLYQNEKRACFRAKGWIARRDERAYPWYLRYLGYLSISCSIQIGGDLEIHRRDAEMQRHAEENAEARRKNAEGGPGEIRTLHSALRN